MKLFLYQFLYWLVRSILFLWHPVLRVTGRENIPQEQNLVICANHRGMADPIWILFAMRCTRGCPRIMAKESVTKIPVLGAVLKYFGIFGVRRGENDIQAIKEALATLKSGQSLLLFPEGTRVKPGCRIPAKSGGVMLAMRTGTPVLPVYLETKRYPFSPMRCVIGSPYDPHAENPRRATPEELHVRTQELMDTIYALGESK